MLQLMTGISKMFVLIYYFCVSVVESSRIKKKYIEYFLKHRNYAVKAKSSV
jgi:hypothetical protein